jgi:hypothetical protein
MEGEEEQQMISKKLIIIIIVIAAIAAIVCVFILHLGNNPAHTVHAHYSVFFSKNTTHLGIKVLATAQTENGNLINGYGPAYLLNGLTNKGYWYQVGIGYNFNWTNNMSLNNYSGFKLIYEIYNTSTGKPLNLGCGVGACVKNFNGIIRNNDIIFLNMSIIGSNVVLSAHDLNNPSVSNFVNVSSYQANLFVHVFNDGYFSGLMTEWRCRDNITNFKQYNNYSIVYPKTNMVTYDISINNKTQSFCPSNQLLQNNLNLGNTNIKICDTSISYYPDYSIIINGSVICPK